MPKAAPEPQPEPPAERPKRLTLSQIVELLLARGSGERSTVTLSRNAKGDTQIDVSVRTGEDGEVVTVEDAEVRAQEVYDRLRVAYPMNGGHDVGSVELTRNAKGETQIGVDVKTSESLPSLADAADKAREEYERTRARYPLSDGYTAGGKERA